MIFDPSFVIESPALHTDAANAIPFVSITEYFYQFITVVHKFLYIKFVYETLKKRKVFP